MNIRISAGVTTVTLTKTEQGVLRKARDILVGLQPYEITSEAGSEAIDRAIDLFCKDTKPEPATT